MFESYIYDFDIRKIVHGKLHINQNEITFSKPCIGYLLKGRGEFLWQGKKYTAEKGDLIYIAAGTRYRSLWMGEESVEWYSLSFSFVLPSAYSGYKFQILRDYPTELFDKMYNTFSDSKLKSVGYLYFLLDDIYSKLTVTHTCAKRTMLSKAIKYIEENYTEKIKISELARMCSCSESYFYNSFKEVIGVSPITYKNNIAVQQAIRYLDETMMSVEEISNMLGFSSPNYFRKIFISIIGKTPTELRKK